MVTVSLGLCIYLVFMAVLLAWCWGGLRMIKTRSTRTVARNSPFQRDIHRKHVGPKVAVSGWVTFGSGVVGIILWNLAYIGRFPGGLFFLMLIAAAFVQTMILPPGIPITPHRTSKEKVKRLAEQTSNQDEYFNVDDSSVGDGKSMRH